MNIRELDWRTWFTGRNLSSVTILHLSAFLFVPVCLSVAIFSLFLVSGLLFLFSTRLFVSLFSLASMKASWTGLSRQVQQVILDAVSYEKEKLVPIHIASIIYSLGRLRADYTVFTDKSRSSIEVMLKNPLFYFSSEHPQLFSNILYGLAHMNMKWDDLSAEVCFSLLKMLQAIPVPFGPQVDAFLLVVPFFPFLLFGFVSFFSCLFLTFFAFSLLFLIFLLSIFIFHSLI
jgi:hypothetical protein